MRTAHNHIAAVRSGYATPYGFVTPDCARFAGFTTFKRTGHVVLSTIAAPACVIQRLARAEATPRYTAANDDEVLARALADDFLAFKGARFIADAAKLARQLGGYTSRYGGGIEVRNALRFVSQVAAPAAKLNIGQMKLDGLDRQEFVERFLGVTAAKAASYVADELFRVCVDIDLHVEALLAEKPLPKRCKNKQSIKDLGFIANVLRAEGQCDPSAADPGKADQRETFDRCNFPGREQVRSMKAKASDKKVAQALRDHLRIDVRSWLKL